MFFFHCESARLLRSRARARPYRRAAKNEVFVTRGDCDDSEQMSEEKRRRRRKKAAGSHSSSYSATTLQTMPPPLRQTHHFFVVVVVVAVVVAVVADVAAAATAAMRARAPATTRPHAHQRWRAVGSGSSEIFLNLHDTQRASTRSRLTHRRKCARARAHPQTCERAAASCVRVTTRLTDGRLRRLLHGARRPPLNRETQTSQTTTRTPTIQRQRLDRRCSDINSSTSAHSAVSSAEL